MAKVENELQIENGPSSNGENGQNGANPGKKAVLRLVLGVVLIIGLTMGVRYWLFVSSHASTENAQITSDVVQIAPQVSGTVREVFVSDNQLVKKGQLIATLDDSTFKAAVDQAKANLAVAIAAAKGAGVNVSLTEKTGNAGITQAQGGFAHASSGVQSAKTAVAQSKAGLASAVANQKRSKAAVSSAQAAVATARANVAAASASVASAQANHDNAQREADRFAKLASAGADSREKADQYATTAASMKAALENSKEQVNSAKAQVEARQADLEAAREQVGAADAAIEQSIAQVKSAQEGIPQAVALQRQAMGHLTDANTAPARVEVSRTDKAKAEANVEQARAALEEAMLQLGYCRICAPVDGRVSKKAVEVGEFVQPGSPLMAIIPSENMWVVANFKETQMSSLRIGAKAEVYVDAFPGHPFAGVVDSVSAGTGATFALLPPDNATGNFVKVVQRVPVKIRLDSDPRLAELIAGTSVTAVVNKR